ncbi:MAG: hypothetical protein AAF985_01465 [Bacteroidota bacterium]
MRNNNHQSPNYFGRFSALLLLFCWMSQPLSATVTYAIPLSGIEHQIGNMLEWSTSEELNSRMFVVERSVDGIDYQNIGVVDAAGISKIKTGYRFMDIGVNDKKMYYRLRQMDADGTASFSQTVMVKKEMSNLYMVVSMTNTTTNKLFKLSIDALDDGQLEYQMTNKNGEVISSGQKNLEFGLNDLSFNLEDEKEGTYFIRLKMKDEEEVLVIRKIDDEIKRKENVASEKQRSGG